MHYQRLTKRGSLEQPASTAPIWDRFWSKVDKAGPVPAHRRDLGPCWSWLGGIQPKEGYGNFSVNNASQRAHRVAYTMLVGAIPDGLTLDHLCRNRACVNPAHLEPTTLRVNNGRGTSPSAINGRKTHCKHGHEFTVANTYIHPKRGTRHCRMCMRNANLRWLSRQ